MEDKAQMIRGTNSAGRCDIYEPAKVPWLGCMEEIVCNEDDLILHTLRVEWKGGRGVDYFRSLLTETDEKEFGFRAIESKIVRRNPRRDESDSELKVDYGRR